MKSLLQKIALAAVLLAPVVAVPAFAHEGENSSDDEVTTTSAKVEDNSSSRDGTKHADVLKKRIELRGKLNDAKKKICDNRSERITNLMTKAAQAGQKGKEFFDSALERIETFYTSKDLSVANYDTLVANVKAKKTAVETAAQAVKDNAKFDCNSDNPIGKIDAFNGQVVALRTALKDYRTSLKTLLEAVKTAAKAAEGGNQ